MYFIIPDQFQTVSTATLDLEDVRTYRNATRSRTELVSVLKLCRYYPYKHEMSSWKAQILRHLCSPLVWQVSSEIMLHIWIGSNTLHTTRQRIPVWLMLTNRYVILCNISIPKDKVNCSVEESICFCFHIVWKGKRLI